MKKSIHYRNTVFGIKHFWQALASIFGLVIVASLTVPLSREASAAASSKPAAPPSEAAMLMAQAQTNFSHGRYQEAVQLYEQARKLSELTPYQKAQVTLGLADAYRAVAKYAESEELFKKAIADAEQDDAKNLNKKASPNGDHASDLVPYMMSDFSLLYLDQSKFAECEQALNDCIALATKKVGPNDINLALPLNGLTRLYIKWGKLREAKEMNVKAFKLFTTPQSKNNWLFAYTAYNLAQLFAEKGDYKKAEQMYKATLLGIQSLFGFEHVYCAIVLEGMGDMYRKEGRLSDAKKAFQQVRSIRAATYSKDHPEYGKVLLDLSLVYRDEGRYAKAQALCQQATTMIDKGLGQNSVEISKCWITAASIARYQGQYSQAEDLARRAIALDQKLLGGNEPTIAHDMVELANILADEGKLDDAEALLNKSLTISSDKLGPEHPEIAETVQSLAAIYLAKKDYAKAQSLYERALALVENSFGKENTKVLDNLRNLSDLLIAEGKYESAESFLKRALQVDPKKSASYARDLNSLADLYSKQNKTADAVAAHKEAAEIAASLPGASSLQKYTTAALSTTSQNDRPVADKWAIVIGISNFKDPSINLKYAAKDATDFRNVLISQENFQPDHVQLLTDENATKDKIISKLGEGWLGKLAKKDDLVVVYVSSHGSASQEDVKVNFLVAEDTDKNKLVSTGIPMQWLTKIVQEQVHSNRVVLVLDVCHSGSAAMAPSEKADSDDVEDDPENSEAKGIFRTAGLDADALRLGSGQIVLCSSLSDQVSWESKHYQNSVFTRRLIEALQCNGKDTTLREAYEQLKSSVGAEVLSDRGAVQTPNLSNKNWSGGDPVLAVPATAARH